MYWFLDKLWVSYIFIQYNPIFDLSTFTNNGSGIGFKYLPASIVSMYEQAGLSG